MQSDELLADALVHDVDIRRVRPVAVVHRCKREACSGVPRGMGEGLSMESRRHTLARTDGMTKSFQVGTMVSNGEKQKKKPAGDAREQPFLEGRAAHTAHTRAHTHTHTNNHNNLTPFSEHALAVMSMWVESREWTKLGGKADFCFCALTFVFGVQSSLTTRDWRLVLMLRDMLVLYTACVEARWSVYGAQKFKMQTRN